MGLRYHIENMFEYLVSAIFLFGLGIMVYRIVMGVDAGFKLASGSGKLKWWLEFVPCVEGLLYGSVCTCLAYCAMMLDDTVALLIKINRKDFLNQKPQTPSSIVEQEQDLAKEANEYIEKLNKRRLGEGNWEQ